MIFFKIALTLCATTFAGVFADVPGGQNAYLPPDKGYKYPTPSKPFITPTRPVTRPPTRPTRPTPGYTPSYTPSYTPTYTPTIRPSYGPPTTSGYSPPSFTPSVGTRPTYRPTPTVPGYTPTRGPTRPTRPTGPPYDGQPSDGHGVHDHHDHHHHHEPGMPFDFSYAVNDIEHGNDYSHNAVSDGDITRGEYRIQLPDGRTQIVKYTADWKNGFNAQVTFEGNPTYPNYQGSGSNQQGGGYKY